MNRKPLQIKKMLVLWTGAILVLVGLAIIPEPWGFTPDIKPWAVALIFPGILGFAVGDIYSKWTRERAIP